ncbi:WHG domain-containing protein [Antrihabitans stalactiti]|uniref:TetR/AcrR family transcriptional regulator n=1 Tax=Antrihabitans stalactiti TaxID=2584121 RepID=A0A848KD58_9NOCA|nr:TetR/AcrR family transcriptional regulator [Antrihabitans stalactiti]
MPRVGLTPTLVVSAAADIADLDGLDALTLARLAEQLDVRVPSLYKHVNGLDDLRRELALVGVRELTAIVSSATVGRSGTDALRALCASYRDYSRRYPGRYAAMQRAPDHDNPADDELRTAGAELVGLFTKVLRGYNFGDDDAIHATRILRSALHGFTALENLGGFGLPQSIDDTFEHLLDVLVSGLTALAEGH